GNRRSAAGRIGPGESPDGIAEQRLRQRFPVQPRRRSLDVAARRYRALLPRARRPAVSPSRGPHQGPQRRGPGMNRRLLTRRRFALLALPACAAACSSPDPALYTLQMKPGPVTPSGPKVVELRDIGLASYLDRKHIVRSSEDYRLGIMSNDW